LKRKAILKDRQKNLAKAIIASANNSKLNAFYASKLLQTIHAETGLEMNSFEDVDRTLVTAISNTDVVNRPSSGLIEFAMNTLSNSPEIIETVHNILLNPERDTRLNKFIYEKLTELSPDQLKICIATIREHEAYKQLIKLDPMERVSIRVSSSQARVLDLIAAFGDHAKTKTLISDFEVFETWDFNNSEAYDRAREAVLGK
jgi:hypothetical protein